MCRLIQIMSSIYYYIPSTIPSTRDGHTAGPEGKSSLAPVFEVLLNTTIPTPLDPV